MAEVTLCYECPVWVTIDTGSNEVTDVQVGDESVSLRENPRTPLDYQALEIAENAEWPEWRFG